MSRKTLLHVDDNPDDLFLFKKACSEAGASFNLKSFDSGRQALDYLQGLREYSDCTKFPLPYLVLLDLKMPPPDGFAVLRWIRNQLQFSQINICFLTSSFQYEDIQKAYTEGANWFLTKPATLDRLIAIAVALDHCLVTSDYGPLKPVSACGARGIEPETNSKSWCLDREAALDEQRGIVSLPKQDDPTAYQTSRFVSLADTPVWLWKQASFTYYLTENPRPCERFLPKCATFSRTKVERSRSLFVTCPPYEYASPRFP